jgi:glycosyltransferase involved in cell wall biosynthesis
MTAIAPIAESPTQAGSSLPRILIVADSTSAKFGGEAAIPLHLFRVLRGRGAEVWLITHSRSAWELQAAFPNDHDRLLFVPDTRMHRLLASLAFFLPHRIGDRTVLGMSRLITQWMSRKIARRLVRELRIDVIHQPIPVSPRTFSMLYDMCAPVVIGPMNGGMIFPEAFRHLEGRSVDWFMKAARLLTGWGNRLVPGKVRAEVLLVANHRTRRALPPGVTGKVLTLVENGVDLSVWRSPQRRQPEGEGCTRFAFVGRLVGWKAVELLLLAFKEASAAADVRLEVIGEGGIRPTLEAMAGELGIAERVTFHGWLSQPQCAGVLASADALVLPSLYECGGAVVLEAMCMGLPVIATNWGGPADYLDPSCGILVEPASREGFIEGLREAMVKLAADPELRRKMGEAGREKVLREYDWERKVDQIIEIYTQVCKPMADRPRAATAWSI